MAGWLACWTRAQNGVGCQRDASRICRALSSKLAAAVAVADLWDRQSEEQTYGRTLDRYIDPAVHTRYYTGQSRQIGAYT